MPFSPTKLPNVWTPILDVPAKQAELGRMAALAARQAKAADRLSKIDLPGIEERQEKTAAALRQAQGDLEAGRPQDIAASQQTALRELRRLDQAINNQWPTKKIHKLAKKQKDLANQMKRNAQHPDDKQNSPSRSAAEGIGRHLGETFASRGPVFQEDEALALSRLAGQATTADEAAKCADG